MKTQYITNDNGKIKAVLMSYKKYCRMLKEIEELEELRSQFGRTVDFEEFIVKRKRRNNG